MKNAENVPPKSQILSEKQTAGLSGPAAVSLMTPLLSDVFRMRQEMRLQHAEIILNANL